MANKQKQQQQKIPKQINKQPQKTATKKTPTTT